jgi:hypothetical protein
MKFKNWTVCSFIGKEVECSVVVYIFCSDKLLYALLSSQQFTDSWLLGQVESVLSWEGCYKTGGQRTSETEKWVMEFLMVVSTWTLVRF